jgi:hypothetical protein
MPMPLLGYNINSQPTEGSLSKKIQSYKTNTLKQKQNIVDPQNNMSTKTFKRPMNTVFDNKKRMKFDPDAWIEPVIEVPRFFTQEQLQQEVARQLTEERARLALDYGQRVQALQSDYMQKVHAMEEELAVISRQWTERPIGNYIS